MSHCYDYVENLIDHGCQEIAERIFCYLNINDLKSAECVCTLWRQVIQDGKIWKRFFDKMLSHPTMKNLYQRSQQGMGTDNENTRFFKRGCHTLSHWHQRLLYNWMTAAQQEEKLRQIDIFRKQVCLDMNSRYIVIGQLNGNIAVQNREDTVGSKDHKELRMESSPSGIHCLQLNEKNLLICGGLGGVIQIWDIHLGKLLKRFTERERGTVHFLKFQNGLLITGSNLQAKSRLTVWNIRNLNISCLEEIPFPSQKIHGLGLDDKYFAVLIGNEPNFEIQIGRTQDFAVISHVLKYCSRKFCGFHFEAGYVAAGLEEGQIKIWMVDTGVCIRNLLRPSYEWGPMWFRFNSRFLVTNNLQGMTIWNFKEAVNADLNPYTRLRCSSFQTFSGSQLNQWQFQMDDFEIVRCQYYEDDLSAFLQERYGGKNCVVRHLFSSKLL